jgi:hypothetical protein
MIRRRVVQGQVFILTRRGWRLVLNGYIRTRKGWRRMRRRPGRRRAPAVLPITDPVPPAVLPSRDQWPGKYAALQAPEDEEQ